MVDFVDFTGKCVVCCVVTTRKKLFAILAYGDAIFGVQQGQRGIMQ
jgi:hypothetical protein